MDEIDAMDEIGLVWFSQTTSRHFKAAQNAQQSKHWDWPIKSSRVGGSPESKAISAQALLRLGLWLWAELGNNFRTKQFMDKTIYRQSKVMGFDFWPLS